MTEKVLNNEGLKNKIATKQESEKGGMRAMLEKQAAQIKMALPDHLTSERFQRQAMTLWNGNPDLQQVDPYSFIAAMMTAAQLGLDLTPTLGQAYIIPYKSKGVPMAQFQLGYRGLLDLAYRTGTYRRIEAREVHKNDAFEIDYGLDGTLRHKPYMDGDRGPVVGYYALFELNNGGISYSFMSRSDVAKHAEKYSKAASSGPWQSDFDEMAKKTVLKALLKYAPLSTEIRGKVQQDETIRKDMKKDMTEVPIIVEAEAIFTEPNQITGEVEVIAEQ